MVEQDPLWQLAPRHYQLPQMSMENIVKNWVDCWMKAQNTTKISISVVWGGKNAKCQQTVIQVIRKTKTK